MQFEPARLWKTLTEVDGEAPRVQCHLCSHFCVIHEGQRGKCGVRINERGILKTMVYAYPAALNVDPVEKKPLYHFLPGTRTFSLGTMGCNMACSFCQNASLSQPPRLGQEIRGNFMAPADLVATAQETGSESISYTYSEPTVFFELVEDTARLARQKGLSNILVTNGFMSPSCLDTLGTAQTGLIQAANVDLKAFTEAFYVEQCGARLAPVLENMKHMRELGWWLEITTLLIPGLNDSPAELAEMAGFIATHLGVDTPWHLSRFHPDHQMLDRPTTPRGTLLAAREIGQAAGLRYVYIGNIAGPDFGVTLCPGCHKALIDRQGFTVTANTLQNGTCPGCDVAISGVWG